jgi:D-xylose transport system substrate-binding protein
LKKSLFGLAVTGAVASLLLAACSSGSGSSATGSAASGSSTAKSTRACVILPDSASSPEWELTFRPDLTKGFTAAGYKVDVQNANGDINKFATIGDQQLAGGCGVMLIVDLQGAGVGVLTKAKAQGVPVIALDRPLAGAGIYVSYNNFKIGQIQGQAIVDALKAEGKNPATASVVYVGGDPTDGNAKQLHDGAVQAMSVVGIKPAAETRGTWDGAVATTAFEQAYTSLHGKVDAVWVANDTNAAGVITILDKYGRKLPVSGQDSTDAGLQNLLLGKQSVDVNTSGDAEPIAAVAIGISILKGQTPTINSKLQDGTPFESVDPQVVTAATVKALIANGQTTAVRLCTTPELKAACVKYGIK